MNDCILCGEPLSKGKVNREHYFPQVLIRNLKKLGFPASFTHALRIDLRGDSGEATLAPISAHNQWATIKVHEKCNLDASPMCQDLKWMIDHLDDNLEGRSTRVIEYYGHIWKMKTSELDFLSYTRAQLDELTKGSTAWKVYEPGTLWAGRIAVINPKLQLMQPEFQKHNIFLGTPKALQTIIDEL